MSDFLSPRSVAIIGASADETKLGGMLLKNMIFAGFDGELYPVNPKGGTIQGFKVYTSFEEIGKAVDLAVIAVPAKFVIPEIEKVGKSGTKYASILTAGFKESGPEGEALENELVATAKKYGAKNFRTQQFRCVESESQGQHDILVLYAESRKCFHDVAVRCFRIIHYRLGNRSETRYCKIRNLRKQVRCERIRYDSLFQQR